MNTRVKEKYFSSQLEMLDLDSLAMPPLDSLFI
jgi:hypothetical protein